MVLPLATMAQETASEEVVAPAVALEVQVGKALYKGDSIPHVILPTLSKYPPLKFANERERQRYNRRAQQKPRTFDDPKAYHAHSSSA